MLLRDDESIKIDVPLFYCPGKQRRDILNVSIERDVQETEAAKERVSALLEKLKNKNKGLNNYLSPSECKSSQSA